MAWILWEVKASLSYLQAINKCTSVRFGMLANYMNREEVRGWNVKPSYRGTEKKDGKKAPNKISKLIESNESQEAGKHAGK